MVGVVDAGFPILLADGRGNRMTSPVVCYAKDKTLLGGRRRGGLQGEMGCASAYDPDAERIHPEPGLAQGLFQGGLMGLQGGDFLIADGAMGRREGFQPFQFRAEDAVHFFQGGGDGFLLLVGRQDGGGGGEVQLLHGGAGSARGNEIQMKMTC